MGFDLTYQPLNQNDKNLSSQTYKEEDITWNSTLPTKFVGISGSVRSPKGVANQMPETEICIAGQGKTTRV
mgnify:CR=1 FL=1